MMKLHKIVLDTNVLIYQGKETKRDIFLELLKLRGSYTAIILSFIRGELKGKSKRKTKGKKSKTQVAASTALALLDEYRAREVVSSEALYHVKEVEADKGEKSADDALIAFAKKENAEICTADKELKGKAEKKGLNVIYFGKIAKRQRER